MFNSNILDVAIGMIFIYLLLSLMCSAANEIIELMLKKRAIDLERGIRELLAPNTDSGKSDIVEKLYNHALINNLFGGTYQESRIDSRLRRVFRTKLPSYIPARNFALALMDLLVLPPDATECAVTKEEAKEEAAKKEAAAKKEETAPKKEDAVLKTEEAVPPAQGTTSPTASKPPSGAANATVSTRIQSAAQFVLNIPPAGGAAAPPPPVVPAEGAPEASPTPPANALKTLRTAIETNPLLTDVSRRSLITLVDAAGNDIAKARENIEDWFNSSMDRVSSWYKRRAQITILIIGLFVAIAVNVDTITVAKRLSTDKALRDSLVNAADAYAKANASPENPKPSPLPSNSPQVTPTPIPECVSNPKSDECKSAKELQKACKDPNSAECQRATDRKEACQEPASQECKSAEALQQACKDPNSDKCKNALVLQQACKDPSSAECQREKEFQQACQDPKSDTCKAATLKRDCEDPTSTKCQQVKACSDPNSDACKRAQALEAACKDPSSPKCNYQKNQYQLQSLGLPIGWDSPDDPARKWPGGNIDKPGGWLNQVYWHGLGWILTALAISLGAPFWFDLLNKFIVIRSAVKPHEKSPEEESKD